MTKDSVAVDGYSLGTEILAEGKYVLTVRDNGENQTVIEFTLNAITTASVDVTDGSNGLETYSLTLIPQTGQTGHGLLDLQFSNPSKVYTDIPTPAGVIGIVVQDIVGGINANGGLSGYTASRVGDQYATKVLNITANTLGNKPDLTLNSFKWTENDNQTTYPDITLGSLVKEQEGSDIPLPEVATVTLGSVEVTGTIRFTIDGVNYDVNVTAKDTAAQVATSVAAQINAKGGVNGYTLRDNGDGSLTFTGKKAENKTNLSVTVR